MQRTRLVLLPLALLAACGVPRPRPGVAAPEPGVTAAPLAELVGPAAAAYLRERGPIVPVAGVEPTRVPDTFGASRGSRRHGALDIMAPRGTPVLAADDGHVIRIGSNRLGGLTIYASDPAGRLVYYYAHLDRYAEGLAAGMSLARGDTIGFVGSTGNASADAPHLHFQVMLAVPGRGHWEGEPIDPRPYLTSNGNR